MSQTTVSRFVMSAGIANDLLALDESSGDMRSDVRNALEHGQFRGPRVTLLLDQISRLALANYLESEIDHPYFLGVERRVERTVARLRDDPTVEKTRPRNSFGGVDDDMFLRLPRQRWRLLYRGSMPADIVRMVETVFWELNQPLGPRITWRIADPNGRIRSTHAGGAAGHIKSTGHITITAGPDRVGVRATVLHELAHYFAGWSRGNHHGPEFYRWLLALYRRFRIPAKWVNWEGRTAAVRRGEQMLRDDPVRFPNRDRSRPTIGAPTPPARPDSTLRASERAAASRPRRRKP